MPKWKKGESGNPGGRPKVLEELRDLARGHAPAAIKELARLALKAKSEQARVAAIRELLDRGYGKPTMPIEGFVETAAQNEAGGGVMEIVFVSPDGHRCADVRGLSPPLPAAGVPRN